MKKIMRRAPKDLGFGFSGESSSTGITIRVETMQDVIVINGVPECMYKRYPEAYATALEDGRIVADPQESKESKAMQEKYDRENFWQVIKFAKTLLRISVICFLLIFPARFVSSLFFKLTLGTALVLLVLARIPDVIYVFVMKLLGKEQFVQMCRYHYAEHAVINAYYDLKRVPTLEEIGKYSGFAYTCGVSKKIMDVWSVFIVGICNFAPEGYYFLAAMVLILLSLWWFRNNLYWTQIISLSKPGTKEYQVAIAAITKALEYKAKVDQAKDYVDIPLENGDVARFVVS